MKFYDLPASPNARRVRIFMAEKGLKIENQVVDMMKGENNEPNLMGHTALERAHIEMWHRRAEIEFLLPTISIWVNSAKLWEGRRTQIPAWAEALTSQLEQSMKWLNRELDEKDYLAGKVYTVADIVAQSAFVMAKAALKMPIPQELSNLSAWWLRVSSRPTARS